MNAAANAQMVSQARGLNVWNGVCGYVPESGFSIRVWSSVLLDLQIEASGSQTSSREPLNQAAVPEHPKSAELWKCVTVYKSL